MVPPPITLAGLGARSRIRWRPLPGCAALSEDPYYPWASADTSVINIKRLAPRGTLGAQLHKPNSRVVLIFIAEHGDRSVSSKA